MNVYDFDGTLYKGESCLHFALYCIIRKPKILIFLPDIFKFYKKHKNNQIKIEELDELFKKLLDTFSKEEQEFTNMVQSFWKKHEKNLNWELIKQIKENDIIISASPSFLLKASPIKDKNIFCSEIDLENKKILFFCYGENKKTFFKEKFKEKKIKKFYTDSYSDMPLMELAEETYLVKNGNGIGTRIFLKEDEICK